MEKKILWILSFALILILWIKAGPFKSEIDDTSQDETAESSSLQEDSGEATSDEISYFKSHPIQSEVPDFAAITDIKERKKTFFNYLTPFVNEKNNLILKDRERLNALLNSNKKMSAKNKKWISTLRQNHKLKKQDAYSKDDIKALLNRLDIIPVSLVLAQAANESAWGTSRFATEGNNYFGQWCFRKGCGLVPESRSDDADHEVRKFHDARESVFAYIDNLNTNAAYKKLRKTRLELRQNNEAITGLALVHGLEHYSQRGQAYVEEIEGLINYNKLWRFNRNQAKAAP
ncbi:flagellar biosynthesis protein FlgJ [Marinomonas sp. CT5]|uniref:glucosaminidase domain-containing protein n=1 Tax=Marinomonas sp. CT5 TaxID=2066133 RepID=UPI0018182591|nr:glucosaminidase domain-containing protein [Marinomonas sp. CT5]NVK73941.1 glucosaminidase domain-containing protein [Oceanospirillaceae bacterium]QUX96893.1 flagellar biosynthesis protein FlgJ [Marinomonas sp. CT5]